MKKIVLGLALCVAIGVSADTSIRYDSLSVGDSLVVIQTVCAPICSSVARVYNKQGDMIGTIPAPSATWVFPQAYIEQDSIVWRDNTYLMLDDEEKK